MAKPSDFVDRSTPEERRDRARRARASGSYSKPGTSAYAGRVYEDAEVEYLRAVVLYQQSNHKRFLEATDHLKVLLSLGYRKDGP